MPSPSRRVAEAIARNGPQPSEAPECREAANVQSFGPPKLLRKQEHARGSPVNDTLATRLCTRVLVTSRNAGLPSPS